MPTLGLRTARRTASVLASRNGCLPRKTNCNKADVGKSELASVRTFWISFFSPLTHRCTEQSICSLFVQLNSNNAQTSIRAKCPSGCEVPPSKMCAVASALLFFTARGRPLTAPKSVPTLSLLETAQRGRKKRPEYHSCCGRHVSRTHTRLGEGLKGVL